MRKRYKNTCYVVNLDKLHMTSSGHTLKEQQPNRKLKYKFWQMCEDSKQPFFKPTWKVSKYFCLLPAWQLWVFANSDIFCNLDTNRNIHSYTFTKTVSTECLFSIVSVHKICSVHASMPWTTKTTRFIYLHKTPTYIII